MREQQKVRFVDGAGDGLYHQGVLAVDYEHMTAVLRVGVTGRLIPTSPEVRIWAGPVSAKRHIYQLRAYCAAGFRL